MAYGFRLTLLKKKKIRLLKIFVLSKFKFRNPKFSTGTRNSSRPAPSSGRLVRVLHGQRLASGREKRVSEDATISGDAKPTSMASGSKR